jgi:hypothetical protein
VLNPFHDNNLKATITTNPIIIIITIIIFMSIIRSIITLIICFFLTLISLLHLLLLLLRNPTPRRPELARDQDKLVWPLEQQLKRLAQFVARLKDAPPAEDVQSQPRARQRYSKPPNVAEIADAGRARQGEDDV